MKASEGRIGRVFVLRFEDGDVIPASIERFAEQHRIDAGQVIFVGGVGGGHVVAGPLDSVSMPPQPVLVAVNGAHEIAAVGILARGENGKPILHIHGALGRRDLTLTGCLRLGVVTWLVAEAIVLEIIGVDVVRRPDERSGFTLLEVCGPGLQTDGGVYK